MGAGASSNYIAEDEDDIDDAAIAWVFHMIRRDMEVSESIENDLSSGRSFVDNAMGGLRSMSVFERLGVPEENFRDSLFEACEAGDTFNAKAVAKSLVLAHMYEALAKVPRLRRAGVLTGRAMQDLGHVSEILQGKHERYSEIAEHFVQIKQVLKEDASIEKDTSKGPSLVDHAMGGLRRLGVFETLGVPEEDIRYRLCEACIFDTSHAKLVAKSLVLAHMYEVLTKVPKANKFQDVANKLDFLFRALAGALRFLCEDLVQGVTQIIFLIKQWKTATAAVKGFTLASIAAGLAVSIHGPMSDFLKIRADLPVLYSTNLGQSEFILEDASGAAADRALQTSRPSSASADPRFPATPIGAEERQPLREATVRRKPPVHKVLICTSVAYWVSMLILPVVILVTGSATQLDEGIPAVAMQYFTMITTTCSLIEFWAVNTTDAGHDFLDGIFDIIYKAVLEFDKRSLLTACSILFSVLGRFDTFSDITFTMLLFQTEDITSFTIYGHMFNLYIPLKYIALFALLFGVFLCQALPAIYFLCRRSKLPMAYKLNEFAFLLAMLEWDPAGARKVLASSA